MLLALLYMSLPTAVHIVHSSSHSVARMSQRTGSHEQALPGNTSALYLFCIYICTSIKNCNMIVDVMQSMEAGVLHEQHPAAQRNRAAAATADRSPAQQETRGTQLPIII